MQAVVWALDSHVEVHLMARHDLKVTEYVLVVVLGLRVILEVLADPLLHGISHVDHIDKGISIFRTALDEHAHHIEGFLNAQWTRWVVKLTRVMAVFAQVHDVRVESIAVAAMHTNATRVSNGAAFAQRKIAHTQRLPWILPIKARAHLLNQFHQFIGAIIPLKRGPKHCHAWRSSSQLRGSSQLCVAIGREDVHGLVGAAYRLHLGTRIGKERRHLQASRPRLAMSNNEGDRHADQSLRPLTTEQHQTYEQKGQQAPNALAVQPTHRQPYPPRAEVGSSLNDDFAQQLFNGQHFGRI